MTNMNDANKQAALDYHAQPKPGKLEIRATKPMATQRDLAMAYSPGVAEACLAIKENPALAPSLTTKGNLVAVISNGSAVLGLGNIGAQASKPVMEGKAVLFKKFANIDCFDIEVNETDPENDLPTSRWCPPVEEPRDPIFPIKSTTYFVSRSSSEVLWTLGPPRSMTR